MLETLFVSAAPTQYLKDSASEAELNQRWGSAFDIFSNPDLKTKATKATASNALLFDTVYACINVLSDDIAKLPFKTYRKYDNQIEQVKDNTIHKLLRIRPNQFMTPFTFMKLLMTDVLTHGNFYAYIVSDKKGQPIELIPLTSQLTTPVVGKNGKLFYTTLMKEKLINVKNEDIIHIKAMSLDGILGISPIQAIRTHLESNDIAGKYNQNMIENGGMPQGILSVTGQLEKSAKDKVRQSWNETNFGESIAIVDNGLEYKQIGISQSDMQWLQSQKYNMERIASIFKVPLHKINDLDKATYSNIEHQSIDYVKNSLQPWVTQIESEFGFKLYTEPQQINGYYVKLNMDSELRGDSQARAKVNMLNLQNGFKTINEIRSSNEDSSYNFDWADEPFVTLNIAPAKNIHMLQQNKFGEHLQGKQDNVEPQDDKSEDDKSEDEGGEDKE